MSQDASRTPIEHNRKEQDKDDRRTRERAISAAIRQCSRAIERGGDITHRDGDKYYLLLEDECRHTLVPYLRDHTGQALRSYSGELDDEDWNMVALDRFLSGHPQDFHGGNVSDRRLIVQAFQSLVAIAETEDLVKDELRNRADATGLCVKTGEHLQDWDMDIGDPVQTISLQAGTVKTLFTGGTGMGKSAALETEAEDFYQHNFRDGRDYKVIDLVGLRDGENWFYDIPQQQGSLQHSRSEMGLPESFDDSDDYESPTMEILAPLTPGLSDQQLPYNTTEEDFVVTPFTVPASELSKPLLVALILSRISDEEEQTIRQAYDDVDAQYDDWALTDLADEIAGKQELGPKHKQRAIGVLRSLQNEGFIRTKRSDYTLNWRDIFTDTETITVFTQAFCDDDIGRLMTVAYLFDAIVDARERMHGIPECVLLMRELWKIAPHNRRQVDDSRAASIQETIGQRLTKVFRENRHMGIHLLADTQWPSDLVISTRKMFNRYVVFGANRDMAKNIFEWTQNDRWKSFWGTMTAKRGEAGIVGQVQPAIDNRRIEYLSPVAYAPASYHHRDPTTDHTGWHARCNYREQEELDRPRARADVSWPDQLPEDLQIGSAATETTNAPDPSIDPVGAFVYYCVEHAPQEWVQKPDVYTAFNNFLADQDATEWDFDDRGTTVRFAKQFRGATEWDVPSKQRVKNGEKRPAFIDTAFTEVGWDYYQNEDPGITDS